MIAMMMAMAAMMMAMMIMLVMVMVMVLMLISRPSSSGERAISIDLVRTLANMVSMLVNLV